MTAELVAGAGLLFFLGGLVVVVLGVVGLVPTILGVPGIFQGFGLALMGLVLGGVSDNG